MAPSVDSREWFEKVLLLGWEGYSRKNLDVSPVDFTVDGDDLRLVFRGDAWGSDALDEGIEEVLTFAVGGFRTRRRGSKWRPETIFAAIQVPDEARECTFRAEENWLEQYCSGELSEAAFTDRVHDTICLRDLKSKKNGN